MHSTAAALQDRLGVGRTRDSTPDVQRHARKHEGPLVEPLAFRGQDTQIKHLADRDAPAGDEDFVQGDAAGGGRERLVGASDG